VHFIRSTATFHLTAASDGDKHIPVANEDFTFHAPEESGRYYYSIFARWTVEDQEDVTRADSIYYVVVEVQ